MLSPSSSGKKTVVSKCINTNVNNLGVNKNVKHLGPCIGKARFASGGQINFKICPVLGPTKYDAFSESFSGFRNAYKTISFKYSFHIPILSIY